MRPCDKVCKLCRALDQCSSLPRALMWTLQPYLVGLGNASSAACRQSPFSHALIAALFRILLAPRVSTWASTTKDMACCHCCACAQASVRDVWVMASLRRVFRFISSRSKVACCQWLDSAHALIAALKATRFCSRPKASMPKRRPSACCHSEALPHASMAKVWVDP